MIQSIAEQTFCKDREVSIRLYNHVFSRCDQLVRLIQQERKIDSTDITSHDALMLHMIIGFVAAN
jgi:hypothetical protein